jgi:hypothetical protein
MKIFQGRIIAADRSEGTVTIQPDGGIVNGIVIGEEVRIVPVNPFEEYMKAEDYRYEKMHPEARIEPMRMPPESELGKPFERQPGE